MSRPHLSVMLDEVLAAAAPQTGDLVIDGTFGAGGYSRAFLERGCEVIGLDRDPSVQPHADRLTTDFPGAFRLVRCRFSEMAEALAEVGPASCDIVVLDIGVSSMQLDQAERGFSFQKDGPLDMRMSDEGPTAADLVNTLDHGPLAHLIKEYGEERESGRIASAILRRRAEQPFSRTLDLAEVVEKAVGGRRGAPIHPATRTFQALRIAVNDELGELAAGLEAAEQVLKPGGRLVVVTFHSLEDRMVKRFLNTRAGKGGSGSRHLPPQAAVARPSFELIGKGLVEAGAAEAQVNPRARSAKLRAAIRTEAPIWRAAA
jgi:16S rRNA (cytosine1402-N4)-methyltransferase